jgi:hypothetical protein
VSSVDPRTAHLARALFADLDYVLGVDPNTLAAFCVRVLDEWDAEVGPTYSLPLDIPEFPTVKRGMA